MPKSSAERKILEKKLKLKLNRMNKDRRLNHLRGKKGIKHGQIILLPQKGRIPYASKFFAQAQVCRVTSVSLDDCIEYDVTITSIPSNCSGNYNIEFTDSNSCSKGVPAW